MNTIRIIGRLKQDFKYCYDYRGEWFYSSYLESKRTSGATDLLPIVISELVTSLNEYRAGDVVEILGEVRTRNDNGRVRVFIFVNDIYLTTAGDSNSVNLDGHICKDTVYRLTPLGREITDIILAVNRRHGTDYIPCVAWGRAARMTERLNTGDFIQLSGRLQSREYNKGVAYEVSIIKITADRGSQRL